MSVFKFFTVTYFVGLAVFALTLLVVLLASAGVDTVGKRIDLAWPIIGSVVFIVVSKFGLAATVRKAGMR